MKAVAFNSSPRRDGNTHDMLKLVLEPIEAAGHETELVQFGGKAIKGCIACGGCGRNQDGKCVVKDDFANEAIQKMTEADAIILGSPTYFADCNAEMKALIDRAGYVCLHNGGLLRRKIGAAVAAVRRAGSIHAIDSMNHFFLIQEMIVPGSTYWNLSVARDKGEVAADDEGVKTMRVLGENIAWLMGLMKPGV